MSLYTLSSSNKSHHITVDSLGCRVTELVLGNKSVFWSGTRPDGKFSATHPCLPLFGKVTQGKLAELPQHGPSRNEEWENLNSELRMVNRGIKAKLQFEWTMTQVEGAYPKGLIVQREFCISDDGVFTLVTTAKNEGKEPLSVNPGEHCYFTCPADKRDDFTLNGVGVKPEVWPNTEYRLLPSPSLLYIPLIGKVSIKAEGYHKCALWSVPEADFLCCEPIMGEPDEVYGEGHILRPGEKNVFALQISLAR